LIALWFLPGWSATAALAAESSLDAGPDKCVSCHRDSASAHFRDWAQSVHARAGVGCLDCHSKAGDHSENAGPALRHDQRAACRAEHPNVVTMCARCHDEIGRAFRESQHFRKTSNRPATPTCIGCHSAAGGSILSGDLLTLRCATCHSEGGAAGRPWVTEKASELLRLLRRVTLARTIDWELLDAARRLGDDTTVSEADLRQADASFRDIPFEWHRFNLEDVEARSRRTLAILESAHDRLERRTLASRAEPAPPDASPAAQLPQGRPLRFAVASIVDPIVAYESYRGLFDDLAHFLGRPYEFVQRRTYREMNELLLQGAVDLAFVYSGGYAALPPDAPIEIIALPVVDGKTVYHSLVVVRARSAVHRFEELQGVRFAFTDPLSNTGYLYPILRVTQLGKDPRDFFASTLFSGSHDKSLLAVYRGLADAAAVSDLVYKQLVVPRSRYQDQFRIVESSPDFGNPPVVAPTSVPAEVRTRTREFLLHLGETPEGRERLATLGFDRFTVAEPDAYTSIRATREAVRAATR